MRRLIPVVLLLLVLQGSNASFDPTHFPAYLWMYQDAVLRPMADASTIDPYVDFFGSSVQIDGDRLAIGDPRNTNGNSGAMNNPGVIYTYMRMGGSWQFDQRIVGPADQRFLGSVLALEGDTLLAESDHLFPDLENDIYVYSRGEGGWTLDAVLSPPDGPNPDNQFASRIVLEGDTMVAARVNGPLYVYQRSGGVWTFAQTLPGTTSATYALADIDIDDGRIAVGLSPDQIKIFEHTGASWALTEVAAFDPALPNTGRPVTVALKGEWLAASQPEYDAGPESYQQNVGIVALFRRQEGQWQQDSLVTGKHRDDYFGRRLLFGDGILAATFQATTNTIYTAVYGMRDGVWYETFGWLPTIYAVGVDGQTVVTTTYGNGETAATIYSPVGFLNDPTADRSTFITEGESVSHTLTLTQPVQGAVTLDVSASSCVVEGATNGILSLTFTNSAPSQTFTITVPEDNVYNFCAINGSINSALTDDPRYDAHETNILLFILHISGDHGPAPTFVATWTPTRTPTNTLPFDPTLTTFTPTPSHTLTLTPTITPSRTPSLTRTASQIPAATHTPTPSNIPTDGPSLTPTFTPSPTLTFTPLITLDPCGFLPTRTPIGQTPTGGEGGDSIGVRTTPCPATYTPTFTSSLTPTQTPTVTPSMTDLPSLTPEPTIGPRQPIQLLVNPGMDHPVPNPVGWAVKHMPTARKDDKMRLNKDRGVFVFKGGPGEKTKLKQEVYVAMTPLQAGDMLNLQVIYRQKGPKPVAHAKLQIRYMDASADSVKLHINARTPDYITLDGSLVIDNASPPLLLRVILVNKSQKPKTKIFVDSVELWWISAP